MSWAVVAAACFAAVFFVAERLVGARRQRVFRRGFRADLIYAPLHVGLRILFMSTIAVAFDRLGAAVLPASSVRLVHDKPLWFQAAAVLVTLDFVFYVLHRWKHRSPRLWRLHETHHSSVDLDFFASVRFHPLEKVFDRTVFLAPFLFLGPSADAVLIWASADAFFGMFGHSNVRWRLGPLKYVFVGPEMHHWHHASGASARECNFGNNFSFFDWIFGTAYVCDAEPEEYGTGDRGYPVENIARQFTYAFRPLPAEERGAAEVAGRAPVAAPAADGRR